MVRYNDIVRKSFFVFLLLYVFNSFGKHRGPQLQPTGLLVTNNAIALSQSDFDSGSYRIQESGYYYLTEDIIFAPIPASEASRTDKPDVGWFTALSIECDNVVFDLNTKTLETSQDFIDTHSFKVFSMIELNNSPFPHFLFAYPGETEIKTAKNVLITNGTLGRSPHHGIHGNGNVNVRIDNLIIRDFEVAGVSLNGLKSGEMRHLDISGIEHEVPFTGLLAVINMALVELNKLKDGGDVNAQPYITALEIMANDPAQNGSDHPSATHDGNAYGLFLNRTVDVGPLPLHCTDATTNCVIIEDVTVCNMKSKVIETIHIQDNNGITLKGERFGVMRWADAYPDGTFAPNALLKAQTYAVNENHPELLPEGFANNILSDSPDETTFLSQVKPGFVGDFAGHTDKGVFGIRVDCGHGVYIKNCRVFGLENIGDKGHLLSDIPAGENYDFDQIRYTGNDVYGVSLTACHNCSVVDTSVFECSSTNGNVNGVSVINESSVNDFINCLSNDHVAFLDNPSSVVNPSSHVYGFIVDNTANSNEFTNCQAQLLESPRYCYGFSIEGSRANLFNSCTAFDNKATSSLTLTSEKRAIGFQLLGTEGTECRECQAINMYCSGETDATAESQSIAAGFSIDKSDSSNDTYTIITDCQANSNNGGAGKGYGMYAKNAQYMTITNNGFANNRSDGSFGFGYGMAITEADGSFIIRNIAHGNHTNFAVSYTDPGKVIPLIYGSYCALASMERLKEGVNISLMR
ncbi:hypothetical protein KC460_01015 [Candidatus Dependentiae bacterium]|nr:hypothetical protein [Candidatus Dependentiae bacterium]